MVSVQKLFQVVKKYLWLMILFAVIGGVVFGVVSKFFITPKYSSTVKFFVNNTGNNVQGTISSSDVSAAQQLVKTYIVILQSDTTLTAISQKAEVNYTPDELKEMIAAGSLSQTEAFYISFTSTDPQIALKLADAAAQLLPDEIKRVVDAGRVSVIDYPKLDEKQDSPNNAVNGIIGAFLGFSLSFAVLFLKNVLDVTIYTGDDIDEACNYPIIGIIPAQRSAEKPNSRKREAVQTNQ